jgi:hypothetical protein
MKCITRDKSPYWKGLGFAVNRHIAEPRDWFVYLTLGRWTFEWVSK